MMPFQRPRGTQDLLPPAAAQWRQVTESMRRCLDAYGYGEIRTPLFEETELFVRGVGTGTDIVSKEMYTFADRKGRSMTLRPEGTAPVVRAFMENNLGAEPGLHRLYYMGPMYRYDRPQAGRYREFFQVGAEAIGSPLAEVDVEVIDLMMTMLRDLGLEDLAVEINSVGHPECRADYEVRLRNVLESERDGLCETCRERARTNPLRVFDCKNPACRAVVERLPLLRDSLCEPCRAHHASVRVGLEALAVPFTENPRLVRGLDYYTRTAFEVHYPPLGAQSALGGGGRYDGLFEACGGPPVPAVGFSSGIERVLVAVEAADRTRQTQPLRGAAIWVAPLGDAARRQALVLARALRTVAPATVDLTGRALKAQMRGADRAGARVVVLLGEDEIGRGEAQVRDLQSGEQIAYPWAGVPGAVRRILETAGAGAG